MLTRRSLIASAGLGLSSLFVAACSQNKTTSAASSSLSGSITAVGSTALQPLVEAAAEQFSSENPGVQINVQGGGSGQGITQIAEGAVQIGNSDVFAEEKLKDDSKVKDLVDNKVAVVGMGPVVNPEVKVDDLSTEQLKGIFTGKITNWKEVGGEDLDIVVINRASGSGTRATFETAVLQGEAVPENFKPQEQDSTGAVTKMVAQTPGSISYVSFYYFESGVKALSLDGVKPTPEAVHTNDWKIWSYEHMYTRVDADEATKAFIDYILSDEVQKGAAADMGYISISDMKVERDLSGNVKTL